MAYLTAAQVRSRASRFMDLDATTYPDGDLNALVAEFEEIAEQYRGVAYVSRTATEIHTFHTVTKTLVLRHPKATAITSITVDGTALDSTSYHLETEVGIVRYDGVFSNYYPATVVYTHGFSAVPERLQRATARYVAAVLRSEESGTSRDVLSQNFDGGTTRYATPDVAAGRPTGWLEVDRLLNSLDDYRPMGIA